MKRLISMAVALCMAAMMGVGAFAADVRYTGFYQKLGLQEGYNILNNLKGTPKEIKNNYIDLGTVYAADKKVVLTGLYDTMFVKADNKRGGSLDADGKLVSTKLTAGDIQLSKIKLSTSTRSGSKAVKKLSLNTRTAEIRLELADEYVATKPLDFEVTTYLSFDGKRVDASALTFAGTMYNREINVYAGFDYVDISDQSIAVANGYSKEVEVYTGGGLSVFTRFFDGNKYYGVTSFEPDSGDEAVFARYPAIDSVVNLKTVGLTSTGNTARFDKDLTGYYVYDKDMKYLGRSEDKLPFRTKYYLAVRRLDGSSSSSSSTASSSSTSSSKPSSSPSSSQSTVKPGDALTLSQVTSLFNTKLKSTPSSQKSISIVAANKSGVTLDTMKGLAKLGDKSGVKPTLIIDQKTGSAVNTRLSINPANATKSIDTFVALNSASAKSTAASFSRWYRNNLFVAGCGQKGSFGMTVGIAVKVPKGFSTSNLYLYSYDSATNSFTRIQNPGCRIDASGYLHFNTKLAGDIVISDGALKK